MEPQTNPELDAATNARKKRREDLKNLIERAGLNPAEIDVTRLMSDEEQQELLRQTATREAAKREAAQLGRQGLREKFRQTMQQPCFKLDEDEKPV